MALLLAIGCKISFLVSGPPSCFLVHLSGPPSGVLPDLQSGIKNVRPFRALRICNPPHLDAQKKDLQSCLLRIANPQVLKRLGHFLTMDCKSVGTKDGWLCILHTLIHFFPIYQSLACFIEFHCQGDDLALVRLEWFGVTLVLYLALGSRNAAIVR